MDAWLKQNGVALLIALASLVGVYTKFQVDIAGHAAQISELTLHVKKLDQEIAPLPVLTEKVSTMEDNRITLEPLLRSLAKSSNDLAIAITELRGALSNADFRLDNIEKKQDKMAEDLADIKKVTR